LRRLLNFDETTTQFHPGCDEGISASQRKRDQKEYREDDELRVTGTEEPGENP
jgi:hypothetical protein